MLPSAVRRPSADGLLFRCAGYRSCESVCRCFPRSGGTSNPPLISACVGRRRARVVLRSPRIVTPLRGARFPDFRQLFERCRPTRSSLWPPFLAVQRCRARLSDLERLLGADGRRAGHMLCARVPDNIPRTHGSDHFEGLYRIGNLVRSLFYYQRNRRTRTNSPVEFPHFANPLVHSCSRCCANAIASLSFEVRWLSGNERGADWQCFEATMKPYRQCGCGTLTTVDTPPRRIREPS